MKNKKLKPPTPETDAEVNSEMLCPQYPNEYVDAEFARKLERERDEAKHDFEEQSEVVRNLKVALMEVSKLTRILKEERDEAREQAERYLAILKKHRLNEYGN